MKLTFLIPVCIFLFCVSFAITFFIQNSKPQPIITPVETEVEKTFVPSPLEYTLEPPAQALTGTVQSVVGEVQKIARDATEEATVAVEEKIVEGDQIVTGENSKVIITFESGATLTIPSETTFSFASTNPKNFLLVLTDGVINIETDSTLSNISVRSLRGLFLLSQGKGTVSSNTEEQAIQFTVNEGSGQAGYIDSDNNTQMVEVLERETLQFDNSTRTINK